VNGNAEQPQNKKREAPKNFSSCAVKPSPRKFPYGTATMLGFACSELRGTSFSLPKLIVLKRGVAES
jgi:hypothetical protein